MQSAYSQQVSESVCRCYMSHQCYYSVSFQQIFYRMGKEWCGLLLTIVYPLSSPVPRRRLSGENRHIRTESQWLSSDLSSFSVSKSHTFKQKQTHSTYRLMFDPNQEYMYRAFSCDVMLSSNMAASLATAINIHLWKYLFTLLWVIVSPWTPPFVVHDERVRTKCAWLPWISRSVCAIWWPCWRTAWCQWKHSIPKHTQAKH